MSEKSSADFQKDVDAFCNWVTQKNMTINVNETKCVTISRRVDPSRCTNIVINGEVIEDVTNMKILGIFFSAHALRIF